MSTPPPQQQHQQQQMQQQYQHQHQQQQQYPQHPQQQQYLQSPQYSPNVAPNVNPLLAHLNPNPPHLQGPPAPPPSHQIGAYPSFPPQQSMPPYPDARQNQLLGLLSPQSMNAMSELPRMVNPPDQVPFYGAPGYHHGFAHGVGPNHIQGYGPGPGQPQGEAQQVQGRADLGMGSAGPAAQNLMDTLMGRVTPRNVTPTTDSVVDVLPMHEPLIQHDSQSPIAPIGLPEKIQPEGSVFTQSQQGSTVPSVFTQPREAPRESPQISETIPQASHAAQSTPGPTQQPVTESAQTPTSATAPKVKATKFDFISPFDIFDDPPPQASPGTIELDKLPIPAAAVAAAAALTSATSTPQDAPNAKKPKKKDVKKAKKEEPRTSTSAQMSKESSQDVVVPAAPVSQVELQIPAIGSERSKPEPKSKRKVEQISLLPSASSFTQPNGPLEPLNLRDINYTFDLLSDSSCGLVHDPSAIEERKISLVKTDALTAGLLPGSTMAASPAIVAYALSKGRVRVLKQDDGVNTLVTLTKADGTFEKVLDIDVTDSHLVALTEDGTIGLWEIDVDSPETLLKLVCQTRREDSFVHSWPRKVRLEAGGNEEMLIMDDNAVHSVTIDKLFGEADWSNAVSRTFRMQDGQSSSVSFETNKSAAKPGCTPSPSF